MKNLFKNEQSGRSMVEMLGVLAIIGVLSVGGISGYSKAMAKFKLTKAQDQITMLIMNIRTAYATSPGYGELDNETAITYSLVPSEMIKSSTAIMNAFGGTTTISAVKGADGTEGGAFSITFAGIGKDACLSLATSDWGADGLAGIGFDVANGKLDANASTGMIKTDSLPLSLSAMTGDSASGCKDPSKNSITWTYF